MDYRQIVKETRSEDPTAVTFDMRKLPAVDQSEAIQIWLQQTGMGAQMGVLKHTKPIRVVCDSKTEITAWSKSILADLRAKGIDVDIVPV